MNIVKIALASSINEFKQEREELMRRIEHLREVLEKQKVAIKFEVWRGHPDWDPEAQKEFDARIRQSHFFFAIIGRAMGKHTKREIGTAHQSRKESGEIRRPRIKTFFRDLTPEEELTPEEIRDGKEAPDVVKAWAVEMGYFAAFSKFERLYGAILTELIMHGVVFPECKSPEKAKAKIRENRNRIRKLSGEDSETELSVLHMENVTLSEAWNVEWGTLYEYADFLRKRGYHENALEIGARLDEHYKSDTSTDRATSKGLFGILRGEPEDCRAALKRLLGNCQMALGEHELAEEEYRAALELYRELAERKGKYRADAAEMCVKVAEILFKTFRHEAAERLYREALEIYLSDAERYAREIGLLCRSMQALLGPRRGAEAGIFHRAEQTAVHCAVQKIHGQMGAVRENLRHWLEAFPCPDTITQPMKDAEAQALEATKDKPDDYERALAQICLEKADWLFDHNQMEAAEAFARKALEIDLKLAESNPDTFENSVAVSCGTLANILQGINCPRETERYYREALEIRRKLVRKDPAAFEPHLAGTCQNLAILLKNTQRHEESERYFREALEIHRRFARKDPAAFEPDLARTCQNLASLFHAIQRYEEAERYFREALEIFRRLAQQDPAAFEPDLARTCQNLAILLKNTQRHEEAERYFREALEIFRRLARKDPAAFEPYLARTCYNYGLFLLNCRQDPAAAKAYFDEVVTLLENYPHYKEWLERAISARSQCQGALYDLRQG